MREGWIPLECVECEEQWEANPADVSPPGNEFACPHCGARRPIADFVATQEGFKILKRFHE